MKWNFERNKTKLRYLKSSDKKFLPHVMGSNIQIKIYVEFDRTRKCRDSSGLIRSLSGLPLTLFIPRMYCD